MAEAINEVELGSHDEVSEQATQEPTLRSLKFSSENYKLEITNLPFKLKYHVVKNLLEHYFKLKPHKIRIGNKMAFVAFASEKERDEAIERIDNKEWKGRVLNAKPALARHDPLAERTRETISKTSAEEAGEETEDITDDSINSKVCPLWDKSYEEQLKIKDASLRSVLSIARQLSKLNQPMQPKLAEWVKNNSKIACKFDGVEPSPSLEGYRNKCEFNVGTDGVVGFRLGRYKDGSDRIIHPPDNCPIINKNMAAVIKAFQNFLQGEGTKLKGFDHVTHAGNVRQITVRTNQKDQSLVIVDMHPQSFTKDELNSEIAEITELMKSTANVVSVYFNVSDKNHLSSANESLSLVHGEKHLYEYLKIGSNDPLKFRIGPTSFFQINTKAAELLYQSVIELADLNSNSLVLDVGCGTGTIGLSLAKYVSYVIGIEIVKSAIEDAKINAEENSITNISFFEGKAEELINESISILKSKLVEQNNQGDIVAIVDPPRIGFNNSFVKSIRASNIKKIVYVACDPKANTNLVSLCRPTSKAYQGDPFVPTRAKAFDLFPHTRFCELVLVYERLE